MGDVLIQQLAALRERLTVPQRILTDEEEQALRDAEQCLAYMDQVLSYSPMVWIVWVWRSLRKRVKRGA